MSAARPRKKRNVGPISRFRLIPVWRNQEFDQSEYARILLLLAMHMSEQATKKPEKRQTKKTKGGKDDE